MEKENKKEIERIKKDKEELLSRLKDIEGLGEPSNKLKDPVKKFDDFEKAFTR